MIFIQESLFTALTKKQQETIADKPLSLAAKVLAKIQTANQEQLLNYLGQFPVCRAPRITLIGHCFCCWFVFAVCN